MVLNRDPIGIVMIDIQRFKIRIINHDRWLTRYDVNFDSHLNIYYVTTPKVSI